MKKQYVKMSPIMVTVPVFPVVCITFGLVILIWVVWPILSFQFFYRNSNGQIVTPLSEDFTKSAQANEAVLDLTKASNWFPNAPHKITDTTVKNYTISIPKVRIRNALVQIGTNDLSESLIHYGGTGLPGKLGNAVIFGHSILPSFYDPTSYIAIFSLLPTLNEGDDIFVHFDDVDYRYQVVAARVVDPEDVSGLEQRHDNSYLTLVTCVPPGTYWKRLWLTAKQVPFNKT